MCPESPLHLEMSFAAQGDLFSGGEEKNRLTGIAYRLNIGNEQRRRNAISLMNYTLKSLRKEAGIALAGVLFYIFAMILGSFGATVLCYGGDGHVTIETLRGDRCGPLSVSPQLPGIDPNVQIQRANDQCGPCVDVSVSDQDKLPSRTDAVSQSSVTANLPLPDPDNLFRAPRTPLRPIPLIIRTVVLLI